MRFSTFLVTCYEFKVVLELVIVVVVVRTPLDTRPCARVLFTSKFVFRCDSWFRSSSAGFAVSVFRRLTDRVQLTLGHPANQACN